MDVLDALARAFTISVNGVNESVDNFKTQCAMFAASHARLVQAQKFGLPPILRKAVDDRVRGNAPIAQGIMRFTGNTDVTARIVKQIMPGLALADILEVAPHVGLVGMGTLAIFTARMVFLSHENARLAHEAEEFHKSQNTPVKKVTK